MYKDTFHRSLSRGIPILHFCIHISNKELTWGDLSAWLLNGKFIGVQDFADLFPITLPYLDNTVYFMVPPRMQKFGERSECETRRISMLAMALAAWSIQRG